MQKIDKTVIKETKYIVFFIAVLSVAMQSVFLVIGKWDYTVLLGNLLSGTVSGINFFLMGITVQKAIDKDEKEAAKFIKMSQSLRMIMLFAVTATGVMVSCFNVVSVILPLFFPRISIILRQVFIKEKDSDQ